MHSFLFFIFAMTHFTLTLIKSYLYLKHKSRHKMEFPETLSFFADARSNIKY